MDGDHKASESLSILHNLCSHKVKIKQFDLELFYLKARLQPRKRTTRPQEESASMLSHTKHIVALIKDVSYLASF